MELTVKLDKESIEYFAAILAQQITGLKHSDEKYYNLKEIADKLNISYNTLLRKKNIPSSTIERGKRKMYLVSEVKEYLKR